MDGTTDPKNTSGETQDPSSEPKGTSETPKTYTENSEKKAVQDALSAVGRDAKTIAGMKTEAAQILENAQKTRTDIKAEREQWQKDKFEASREAVKDDPTALKSLQREQRQTTRDAELATREQDLNAKEKQSKERLEKADEITKELRARDIASKHNIDTAPLLKFTDGSPEAMEELAKQLPKKGETKPSLKTDTSTTLGGSLSDDALIKKSASGESLNADEKKQIKQALGNLKGNLV